MSNVVSAVEALKTLSSPESKYSLIDVRAEKEFNLGHIPRAQNVPILNNEHRHLVGTKYKKDGQEAAIKLGYQLVTPIKEQIIAKWKELQTSYNLVYCWRGGLRSKISCEWMESAKLSPTRIEGGYKALRTILLATFEKFPPFLILSGMTGSGKTELIQKILWAVDLEGIANHRGSAFGALPKTEQPTQQSFENALAMNFFMRKEQVLLEDESRNIGRVILPNNMYEVMSQSPSIIVEESSQIRARYIFETYVLELERQGSSLESTRQFFQGCLNRISRKLGGLEHTNITHHLTEAFKKGTSDPDLHIFWIQELLEKYYDKMYSHALDRKTRPVLFRGDRKSCLNFLEGFKRAEAH